MAKNRNTFIKRQREMDKKRKAAEKLEKKRRLKEEGGAPAPTDPVNPYADFTDDQDPQISISTPQENGEPTGSA